MVGPKKQDFWPSINTPKRNYWILQIGVKLPKSALRNTDTQWRHKSKKSEKLDRCGSKNMLRPYLKIWDWDLIFGSALKTISSLGIPSLCTKTTNIRTVLWNIFLNCFFGICETLPKRIYNSHYGNGTIEQLQTVLQVFFS